MDPVRPDGGWSDTGRWDDANAHSTAPRVRSRRVTTTVLLLAVIGLVAGVAVAADSTPPEFGNATKVDDTTFTLQITDDENVSEASIDADDFALSAGNLTGVDVRENGSNATVTFHLRREIPDYRLYVGLTSSATVADEANNSMDADDSPMAVVEGMDGIGPVRAGLNATRTDDGRVQLVVTPSESLGALNVTVEGPASDTLDRSDFGRVGNDLRYRSVYDPPADGRYEFTLVNVTDRAGNLRHASYEQVVRVDGTPPRVDAGIDVANSSGFALALEGRATDANDVTAFTWTFGNESNATGPVATHRFDGPGTYDVTLAATDEYDNTGTTTLRLRLGPGGIGNAGNGTTVIAGPTNVTVERDNPVSPRTAMVHVDGAAASERVTIGPSPGGSPVVEGRAFRLRGLSVSMAQNASFDLAIEAAGPGSLAGFEDETGDEPVGAVTVVKNVPPGSVDRADFRFAVDRSRVRAANASATAVSLFRRVDGTWTELPTEVTGAADGRHRFEATSPGFSRFAIGVAPDSTTNASAGNESRSNASRTNESRSNGSESDGVGENASTPTPRGTTPTPTATPGNPGGFVVTNATVNATEVDPGGTVLVEMTVENRDASEAVFTAGVTLDGSVVETSAVRVPGGESRTRALPITVDATGSHAIAVNGTSAGTVQVDSAGGGGLLGFLPMGLLEPLALYLGLPLLVIYLILKALAIYLGY